MRFTKLLTIIFFSSLSISSHSCEGEKDSTYLDVYLISMTSDLRNYVLALEFSNTENEGQDDLLRSALEMKYYDLSNLLTKTNNKKVVSVVCMTEKTLRDNAIKVSKNCSTDLCKEIKRLEIICSNIKSR